MFHFSRIVDVHMFISRLYVYPTHIMPPLKLVGRAYPWAVLSVVNYVYNSTSILQVRPPSVHRIEARTWHNK